jgi:hypothetical protein
VGNVIVADFGSRDLRKRALLIQQNMCFKARKSGEITKVCASDCFYINKRKKGLSFPA